MRGRGGQPAIEWVREPWQDSTVMNKQEFLARRDYLNLVHGVTVRAIGAFSDDELGFRPRPEMRTPRELAYHIYSQEKLLAEAAQSGRFTIEAANRSNPEDPTAAPEVAALRTLP